MRWLPPASSSLSQSFVQRPARSILSAGAMPAPTPALLVAQLAVRRVGAASTGSRGRSRLPATNLHAAHTLRPVAEGGGLPATAGP
jgi:hypothetical protein